MKTLELNFPTPVLLVWGLPESTVVTTVPKNHRNKDFIMHFQDGDLFHFQADGECDVLGKLPDGNWQLIGKLSELTEEVISAFVEGESASDTFCMAINDKGYFITNPVKHPDQIYTTRDDSNIFQKHSMKKWNEAQSKTLPANTLIFKRV